MTLKPMAGDGPGYVFEDEPPVSLGELIATSEDNFDVLGALAFARMWPEEVAWRDLDPWQRVGPDALWMVNQRDYSYAERIGRETVDHLLALRWVRRKRLSRIQLERAVIDAINRLVERECMPAEISALAVALRKETFLDLRAEATAFLVNCMAVAEISFVRALGRRELDGGGFSL